MKRFNEFIDESIRDKMTGPNTDPREILKDENTSANQKISMISDHSLKDYFTDEELDELKRKAAEEIINDIEYEIAGGEYETLITFILMGPKDKTILNELSDSIDTMELMYQFFYEDYKKGKLFKNKNKKRVAEILIKLLKENIDTFAKNFGEMYEL